MDLVSLVSNSRSLTVEHDGESLDFTYAPNKLDSTNLIRLTETAEQGSDKQQKAAVALLSELLMTWSLTDGGAVTKPDHDILMRLPVGLLNKCMSSILEDLNSPKAPGPSKNGS